MANNNIFEGAEFGDRFLTRDGRKALFIALGKNSRGKAQAILFVEGELNQHAFDIDGYCPLDDCMTIASKLSEADKSV